MEMAPQVPSTQPGGQSHQSCDGSSSSCLEGMGDRHSGLTVGEGVAPPCVPLLPAQPTHTALGMKFSTSVGMFASKNRISNLGQTLQLCSCRTCIVDFVVSGACPVLQPSPFSLCVELLGPCRGLFWDLLMEVGCSLIAGKPHKLTQAWGAASP